MNTTNSAAAVILLADDADGTQFHEAARFTFTLGRHLTPLEFVEAAREEIFEELAWKATTDWARRYRDAGHRGLRIGDIIELDGNAWMCDPYGWINHPHRNRNHTLHQLCRTLWPPIHRRLTPRAPRHRLAHLLRSTR